MVWRKVGLFLHQNLKLDAMRNTDFNIDAIGNFICTDNSLQVLKDIISDLGLEFEQALLG